MSDYQYIQVSLQDGVTVVHIVDPMIQERLLIHELGNELIGFIERESPLKLLINFERVTYCSSEVLGGLIRARQRVLAIGGMIRLSEMKPEIRELFQMTHLEGKIFDIDDSAEQAIETLSSA